MSLPPQTWYLGLTFVVSWDTTSEPAQVSHYDVTCKCMYANITYGDLQMGGKISQENGVCCQGPREDELQGQVREG